jgi:hypothetical protein
MQQFDDHRSATVALGNLAAQAGLTGLATAVQKHLIQHDASATDHTTGDVHKQRHAAAKVAETYAAVLKHADVAKASPDVIAAGKTFSKTFGEAVAAASS